MTDPIIVSFQKSGRTWVRYACTLAGLEPTFTHAGHGADIEETGRRSKTIPHEFRNRPVIFLHRNPLDTAVSYYFQCMHKDLIPGRKRWALIVRAKREPHLEIDKFVTDHRYGVPLIAAYNRAWLDYVQATPGSMSITYEELKADPEWGFGKIFKMLGAEDADPKPIAEAATFEKMKALQDSGQGDVHRLVQPFPDDPEGAKVRRGKVRGYFDYLKPSTIKTCARQAAKFGFEI